MITEVLFWGELSLIFWTLFYSCDLLERPDPSIPVSNTASGISLTFKPFQIRSLLFILQWAIKFYIICTSNWTSNSKTCFNYFRVKIALIVNFDVGFCFQYNSLHTIQTLVTDFVSIVTWLGPTNKKKRIKMYLIFIYLQMIIDFIYFENFYIGFKQMPIHKKTPIHLMLQKI